MGSVVMFDLLHREALCESAPLEFLGVSEARDDVGDCAETFVGVSHVILEKTETEDFVD